MLSVGGQGSKVVNGGSESKSEERTRLTSKGFGMISLMTMPRVPTWPREGREFGMKEPWCNPRGDDGNSVLNKEHKKKKGQNSHSLRIKCIATTCLTALMAKWPWIVATQLKTSVGLLSEALMGQVSRKWNPNPSNVKSRCIPANYIKPGNVWKEREIGEKGRAQG